MGTGVCGVLLHAVPWPARWLAGLSVAFFALDALLFATFAAVSALRFALWPEIWAVMIVDPTHSLFLGTVPISLATLLQLWVAICVPAWGEWASTFVWVLWMVDVVVAVAIAISLPFLLFVPVPFSLPRIT
jgi:tellurite resistance protein TehA-like permease